MKIIQKYYDHQKTLYLSKEHEISQIEYDILQILIDWDGYWSLYEGLQDCILAETHRKYTISELKNAMKELCEKGLVYLDTIYRYWDFCIAGSGWFIMGNLTGIEKIKSLYEKNNMNLVKEI